MKQITIAIGTDHRGYLLKQEIIKHKQLATYDIMWQDVGTYNEERTDYPPFAKIVCTAILTHQADYGILLCGTGVGMSIAANRFEKIYAGIAWDATIARRNKEEDKVNVLILPADYVTQSQALEIISTWLSAEFKEGHYQQRIEMVDKTK